jgi:hypothetical protein
VLQFLSRPIIAKSRETVGAMFTLPPGLSEALKQADLIIDHGPEAVPAPERAKPQIANKLNWLDKQTSPDSSRKTSCEVGGWKLSKEIWLENSSVLDAYNIGSVKRISNRSIARYLIASVLLSFSSSGAPKKIRQPPQRFQKRARQRTPAELEGLRIGNERRHEQAAQKRREAKAVARV